MAKRIAHGGAMADQKDSAVSPSPMLLDVLLRQIEKPDGRFGELLAELGGADGGSFADGLKAHVQKTMGK